MNLLSWLERRFGRYALPQLSLWLLVLQAVVYLSQFLGPNAGPGRQLHVYEGLMLDVTKVLNGEWWRLFTFPFLAPLWHWWVLVFFYFYFFYLIATTLETAWGSFRFNLFFGIGYLATVGAAFLAHAISPGAGQVMFDFMYGSLFLAFARLYPDFTIMLMFVLPVQIKWLARVQWFWYWFLVVFGDWYVRLMVLAAILNYLIFFGSDVFRDAKHGHRRMQHRAKTLNQPTRVSHECRVCGLTSDMAPKTQFRYCSQCAGSCCYCPEHLKNHEHAVGGNDQ